VRTQRAPGPSKSLEARLSNCKSHTCSYCDHCKCPGHWTSKCHKFEGNRCHNCGKVGHQAKDCWLEKKNKGKKDGKGKGTEKSNVVGEQIAFMVDEELVDEELYNFDMFEECNAGGINEHLVLYDWLADSATTLHITHQWEAFTSYTHLGRSSVTGVGGNQVTIAGQGTVELVSTCNGQEFILLV